MRYKLERFDTEKNLSDFGNKTLIDYFAIIGFDNESLKHASDDLVEKYYDY